MTKREKQKYLRRHFSRECQIVLLDVKKTKYYKKLQRKMKVAEGNYGRRKHSCYICFQKFFTKEDLAAHKFIHYSEKSNDTFSDENEEIEDNAAESSKEDGQVEGVPIESDSDEIKESVKEPDSLEIDTTSKSESKPDESECFAKETNYKCITCNVYFINQVDVKAHIHNQYFCKYSCKQCDRQFNTKGGFIVHVLQHDMTNISKLSFRCNKCPYSFDDCYKLKKHYATAHNIDSKSTAKYAESIVKSGDNPSVKIDKPDNILLESKETTSSALSTERLVPNATTSSLDKLKKDSDNPITGTIPIFDCDVCYDVFSSAKALNRHKTLHRELEKTSDLSAPILIEDDDVQVVQNDDTSNKQTIVSNFTTTHSTKQSKFITPTPMAKLTPLWSETTSSILPSKPNILTKQPISNRRDVYATMGTSQMGNDSLQPGKVGVEPGVDKKSITAEITGMLAGRKSLPKVNLPKLVPLLQPRLDNNRSTAPSKMCQLNTNINAANERPETSAPLASSNMVSNAGQPQYMYVLCPQSASQSTGMPSGGQAVMMIDPSSPITANSPAGFVLKNQGHSTIMPSSGPNQFIINQQINTGGVVINPQAGSVPGSSFVFNQNIERQAPGVQESPMLQAVSGLQGSEGGQRYYVVLPPNQSGTITPNIGLAPPNSHVLQPTVKPNMAGVMRQDASHNFSGHPNKPMGIGTKLKNILLNPSKTKKTVQELAKPQDSEPNTVTETLDISRDDSNSYEPTMPIITSVEGESPDERDSENRFPETHGDYSNMVMPIITSIGTVAENSKNVKAKVRKDPVSKYESEFARFLEQNEGSTAANDEKNALRELNKKRFAEYKSTKETNDQATKAARADITDTSVVSDDDVIFLDDNSSSNESNKNLNINPATKTVCTVSQSESAQLAKPKIFVKKLSDLRGSSQTGQDSATSDKSEISTFKHCCLCCSLPLKDWYDLRIHLKTQHMLYACVYSKCLILKSLTEYRKHIKDTHHCVKCQNDFGDLRSHEQKCHVTRNSEPNQDIDKRVIVITSEQNSNVSDIFSVTGTDVNF